MHGSTSAGLAVAFAAGFAACGGDGSSNRTISADNPVAGLTQAVSQMQKAAEAATEASNRKPVPPVSYKVLLDYIPKSMGDMKADPPKGQTTSAGEWQYSQAEADYRSEDGNRQAEVGIFDYAHIPMLYMPFQMMLGMKVNTESTEGYQHSVQVGGFPAYEKWTNDSGENEVVVMVSDRFVVKASTRGVGEGSARKIVEDMDLKGLATKAGS
jgi:hypothetical protein